MFFFLLSLFIAFYVAWSMGANDETMAVVAGSKFVGITFCVVLGAFLAFLGSILMGERVEKTLGQKFLSTNLTEMDVLIIMFSVACWLTFSSIFGLPVSTTHAAAGAAIGLGIAKGGLIGVNWNTLSYVSLAWLLSPLIGCIITIFIAKLMEIILTKYFKGLRGRIKLAKYFFLLLLFWTSFTEFSRGGNDIANATAFLSRVYQNSLMLRIIAGVGLMLGLIVLGRRVVRTVGLGLVELNPERALSAQISTGSILFLATLYGLPLSGTHVLVGSLIGISLSKKIWLNLKKLGYVVGAWVGTFILTGITSSLLSLLF